MPPAAVVTSGVPLASASITTFGRPSTFPASSRTDGVTMTSAAANSGGDLVLRAIAEKAHAFLNTGRRARAARSRRGAILHPRSPARRPARRRRASIRYSNPFLLTSRPAAATSSVLLGDAELLALRASRTAVRTESRRCRRRTGPRRSRSGSAPSRIARAARSALHAVTQPARRKAARAARRAGAQPLGDVHVRPVQADDQRQPGRRHRGGDAAGYHPVAVHDRRPVASRDAPRRPPPGGERERRGGVRGASQA